MLPIMDHFTDLKDPRVERCRLYPLVEILTIQSVCDYLRRRGLGRHERMGPFQANLAQRVPGTGMANGIPTDGYLRRVLSRWTLLNLASAFYPGTQRSISIPEEERSSLLMARPCGTPLIWQPARKAIHMVERLGQSEPIGVGASQSRWTIQLKITGYSGSVGSVGYYRMHGHPRRHGNSARHCRSDHRQGGIIFLALKGKPGHYS